MANSGEFLALKAMTDKNVRARGQYDDDQSGVWQAVALVRTRALAPIVADSARSAQSGMTAGTTLVDVLDKVDDATRAAREATVKTILDHFSSLGVGDALPIGFAYAIGGEPQGVRVFAASGLLRRNLESFATTMALEAEVAGEQPGRTCTADDVVAMVRAIETDAATRREQTGATNVNVLRSNEHGYNGNCYVQDAAGQEIPLTQDWTKK